MIPWLSTSLAQTGHVKVFAEINNYRMHEPTVIELGREVDNNQG